MPRRFPTLTTGSALALAACVPSVSLAAQALLSSGRSVNAPGFKISGRLAGPLAPGVSQSLDLRLSNGSRKNLLVTRLTVSLRLDATHRRAGCSAKRSFRVTQLKRSQYPIALRAGRTRSLRALGLLPLPRVRMVNLPTNQDACKGATLRLRFGGRARRGRLAHAP
jgi:hypothetical protein